MNLIAKKAEDYVLASITADYVTNALKDVGDPRDVGSVATRLLSIPARVRLKATASIL